MTGLRRSRGSDPAASLAPKLIVTSALVLTGAMSGCAAPIPANTPLVTAPPSASATPLSTQTVQGDPARGLIVLSEGGAFQSPSNGWATLATVPDARWVASTPLGLVVTVRGAILLGRPDAGPGWQRVVPHWPGAGPGQPLASAVPDADGTAFALLTLDSQTAAATVSLLARDGPVRSLAPLAGVLWPAAAWIDARTIAVSVLREGRAEPLCAMLIDIEDAIVSTGPCGRNLVAVDGRWALLASHTRDAAGLIDIDGWLRGPAATSTSIENPVAGATLEAAAFDAGARLAVAWWDASGSRGQLDIYALGPLVETASYPLTTRPLGVAWLR